MSLSFNDCAQKLNHSLERLEAGEEIQSTITVPDIDALRILMDDGASSDIRRERTEAIVARVSQQEVQDGVLSGFWHLLRRVLKMDHVQQHQSRFPHPIDPINDGSEAGILRRVAAFIYGDAPLDPIDRKRTAHLFPMAVSALSAKSKTISAPWDLGESKNLCIVCLGTLTMEDGSSIFIKNTPLQFKVDTLIRNGAPPPGINYDIAILGVTGAAGTAGSIGGMSNPGGTGINGNCASPGIQGDAGKQGNVGATGGVGGTGGLVGDGKASLSATIVITTGITGSVGAISILTQSGAGGTGGPGGTGGTGATGGVGGVGATCGCEGTNGGPGGTGGTGGQGGIGGTGGNGVPGNDIYVTVPPGQKNKIIVVPPLNAPGGVGGLGGATGPAGGGGAGGGGGKHHDSGGGGGGGAQGTQGQKGATGGVGVPGHIYVKEG